MHLCQGLELRQPEIKIAVDTALLMLLIEHQVAQAAAAEEAASAPTAGSGAAAGGGAPRGAKALALLGLKDAKKTPEVTRVVWPYTLRDLLFPENLCLQAESEHFLVKNKQYNALALLCQSKGKFYFLLHHISLI